MLVAYRSASAAFKALAVGVLMTVGGVVAITGTWTSLDGPARVVVAVVLGIAMAFFAALDAVFVAVLLRRDPMLRIDDTGVDDRRPLGAGRVAWSEVVRVEMRARRGQPYLNLVVTDPQAVIGRQSFVNRLVMRLGARSGEPVVLTTALLDTSPAEVEAAIRTHLHRS